MKQCKKMEKDSVFFVVAGFFWGRGVFFFFVFFSSNVG